MYKTITRYTFICSFILGALLRIIFFEKPNINKTTVNYHPPDKYEKWFNEQNLKRIPLSMDYIHYSKPRKPIHLESKFLYDKIKISCVILTRKRKNAAAANETWARQCNDKQFIYLQPEKIQKTKLPIRQTKLESSWHLLCDAIRAMNERTFHWVLFLNDDMFAVPENARRMVAGLDPQKGHYLGHAITFWGTKYNAAQAGYLLSKGSIELLKGQFNTTEACAAGGRFWKQEDYYLGKHLANLGVFPTDTRDHLGLTTFHGHSLAQLLTPGSLQALAITNYYMRSVYPSDKCCSEYAVTFQTVEGDKMYTNNYILYQLQVFRDGGSYGNIRNYHKPEDDEIIWRKFVSEQRGLNELFQGDISPEAYFELWKTLVNDPINFNQNIRKWSASTTANADPPIRSD